MNHAIGLVKHDGDQVDMPSLATVAKVIAQPSWILCKSLLEHDVVDVIVCISQAKLLLHCLQSNLL